MNQFEIFNENRDLLVQIIRNQAKIAHFLEHINRKVDVCMKELVPDQQYAGNEHLDDFLTVMLDENENLFGEIYAKAKRLREENKK
ncbi:hypothetical protein ACUNWD_03605 [Sunxiuqinia sp. A32]|uniref:hypothetical protein n=1 Tax=Sunxiuqinia sp. A32 TaxID=3461496 RepID=UPI004045D95F